MLNLNCKDLYYDTKLNNLSLAVCQQQRCTNKLLALGTVKVIVLRHLKRATQAARIRLE